MHFSVASVTYCCMLYLDVVEFKCCDIWMSQFNSIRVSLPRSIVALVSWPWSIIAPEYLGLRVSLPQSVLASKYHCISVVTSEFFCIRVSWPRSIIASVSWPQSIFASEYLGLGVSLHQCRGLRVFLHQSILASEYHCISVVASEYFCTRVSWPRSIVASVSWPRSIFASEYLGLGVSLHQCRGLGVFSHKSVLALGEYCCTRVLWPQCHCKSWIASIFVAASGCFISVDASESCWISILLNQNVVTYELISILIIILKIMLQKFVVRPQLALWHLWHFHLHFTSIVENGSFFPDPCKPRPMWPMGSGKFRGSQLAMAPWPEKNRIWP